MKLKQRIKAFVQLGEILEHVASGADWPGYTCGINENEYQTFVNLLPTLKHSNGWFTEVSVKSALSGLSSMLIESKLEGFDAVIATGSNNSARYFQQYFGHVPHIIRKNRTSVAILDGTETKVELKNLGSDIFNYYGLGCRNVSKIYIPKDYDLDALFGAIVEFGDIIHHNKYCNNYDYNKAMYLMNLEELLDNGFLLLKESQELHSPLAVLFYQRYDQKEDLEQLLEENKTSIQCIVGHHKIPFGRAQFPRLNDYADGIDTMTFLQNI